MERNLKCIYCSGRMVKAHRAPHASNKVWPEPIKGKKPQHSVPWVCHSCGHLAEFMTDPREFAPS